MTSKAENYIFYNEPCSQINGQRAMQAALCRTNFAHCVSMFSDVVVRLLDGVLLPALLQDLPVVGVEERLAEVLAPGLLLGQQVGVGLLLRVPVLERLLM